MSKQTNKNRRKYLNILLFEVLIPVQEWEKIEGTLKLLLVLNLFGKRSKDTDQQFCHNISQKQDSGQFPPDSLVLVMGLYKVGLESYTFK